MIFWKVALDNLQESDPSYASVDEDLLQMEMTALRLELFALAWFHHFQEDKYTVPQSVFSRKYLLENGRDEIWETMMKYNQAIARSGQFQAAELQGYFISRDERIKQKTDAMIDLNRFNWFKKHEKSGVDLNSIARIANRIGTSQGWEKSMALAVVAAAVSERLGSNLKEEGRTHLIFLIRMVYEGSRESIKTVKIVPN